MERVVEYTRFLYSHEMIEYEIGVMHEAEVDTLTELVHKIKLV